MLKKDGHWRERETHTNNSPLHPRLWQVGKEKKPNPPQMFSIFLTPTPWHLHVFSAGCCSSLSHSLTLLEASDYPLLLPIFSALVLLPWWLLLLSSGKLLFSYWLSESSTGSFLDVQSPVSMIPITSQGGLWNIKDNIKEQLKKICVCDVPNVFILPICFNQTSNKEGWSKTWPHSVIMGKEVDVAFHWYSSSQWKADLSVGLKL